MSVYSQLTLEQRYSIFALLQSQKSKKEIALIIKCDYSTICREVKRNSINGEYNHKKAHKFFLERRKLSKKSLKLTDPIKDSIVNNLKNDHWSPEQIAGRARLEKRYSVCAQTIYNWIAEDKSNGGKIHKYLKRQRTYVKRKKSKNQVKGRVSIDERPAVVDELSRIGDWEADTVVSGKGDSTVILTLVERKSRYTRACLLESRDSLKLAAQMVRLLKHDKALTITSDNGTEFAAHKFVSNQLGIDFYFAHPYHSWERGCNENTNGLLRFYLPKGISLKGKRERLSRAVVEINNRPRKSLGYRTPREVYEGYLRENGFKIRG